MSFILELLSRTEKGKPIPFTEDKRWPYPGEEEQLAKRLSAEWGQPGARRKRLVARLKRHRTYNPPVKGGRRKRRFGK